MTTTSSFVSTIPTFFTCVACSSGVCVRLIATSGLMRTVLGFVALGHHFVVSDEGKADAAPWPDACRHTTRDLSVVRTKDLASYDEEERTMKRFDAIVIGAGQAGPSLARRF